MAWARESRRLQPRHCHDHVMSRLDVTIREAAEVLQMEPGVAVRRAAAESPRVPGAIRQGRMNAAGPWRVDGATLRAALPTAAARKELDRLLSQYVADTSATALTHPLADAATSITHS